MTKICWLRRDLRLHDHAALSASLESGETILVFIFDAKILDVLKNKNDRRVTFIYQSLVEMEREVQKKGSSIIIHYGDPVDLIPKIAKEYGASHVFTNRDYEPYAKERDAKVEKALSELNVHFELFKDSVMFEKEELKTGTGGLYKVFTPYKNKWLEAFEKNDRNVPDYHCDLRHLKELKNEKSILTFDWYKTIGFSETPPLLRGGTKEGKKRLSAFKNHLAHYAEERNFPARSGTSLLSVYLRFGNVSVRDVLREGVAHRSLGAKTWVSELIWRDFYQMVLDAYPYVADRAFKPEYDKIKFPGGAKEWKAWCEGRTGYPIVDAAMRCLNETGMMHNRLRMVVASFLCKILLIHWQKGEHYFAEKLLDFDLAANNGGWQWSSSSGCDAQPYFRIFNPYAQSEKFDPDGTFIRRWVPEVVHLKAKDIHRPNLLKAPDYIPPIVSYELNRERCLHLYSVVKDRSVDAK